MDVVDHIDSVESESITSQRDDALLLDVDIEDFHLLFPNHLPEFEDVLPRAILLLSSDDKRTKEVVTEILFAIFKEGEPAANFREAILPLISFLDISGNGQLPEKHFIASDLLGEIFAGLASDQLIEKDIALLIPLLSSNPLTQMRVVSVLEKLVSSNTEFRQDLKLHEKLMEGAPSLALLLDSDNSYLVLDRKPLIF